MPTTLNIKERKKAIENYINQTDNIDTIEKFEEAAINTLPPFGKPLTKKQLISDVAQSLKNIEEGNVISEDDLIAESEQW